MLGQSVRLVLGHFFTPSLAHDVRTAVSRDVRYRARISWARPVLDQAVQLVSGHYVNPVLGQVTTTVVSVHSVPSTRRSEDFADIIIFSEHSQRIIFQLICVSFICFVFVLSVIARLLITSQLRRGNIFCCRVLIYACLVSVYSDCGV